MFIAGHIVTGLLIGEIAILLTDLAPSLVLIWIGLGSIFPSFDILFEHRKSLHYPRLYFIVAVFLIPLYVALGENMFAYGCLFMIGAGIHSLTDILGSGKELRPWQERDKRAVYDHMNDRFIEPKRVYYDGSFAEVSWTVLVSILLLVIRPSNLMLYLACIASSVLFRFFQIFVARRTEKFDTWSQLVKYQIFGGDPRSYDQGS